MLDVRNVESSGVKNMRIECSVCGKIHDSNLSPFTHDIVRITKERQRVEKLNLLLPPLVLNLKESESSFICKHCGTMNYVVLRWFSTVEEKIPPDNNK